MKRHKLIINVLPVVLVLLVVSASAALAQEEEPVPVPVPRAKLYLKEMPAVVAEIDNKKVTRHEFMAYILENNPRVQNILDGLIIEELIASRAKKEDVSITEKEIDTQIDVFRSEVKVESGGATTLEKELEKQGVPIETFRRQTKLQLLMHKLFNLERGVEKDKLLSTPVELENLNIWGKNILNLARKKAGKEIDKEGVIAIVNNIEIPEESFVQLVIESTLRDELVQYISVYLNDVVVERSMKSSGVKLEDKDLEDALGVLEMQFHARYPDLQHMSLNDFLKAKNSSVDELKKSPVFRQNVLMTKLIGKEIKEADLRKFYDDNKVNYGIKIVKISHILALAVDPKTMELKSKDAFENALMRIQKAQRELKSGADFKDMVTKYSEDDQTNGKGGELGYLSPKNKFDPDFSRAALKLKKGEVSDPVRTVYGYHLIKCTETPEPYEFMKTIIKLDLINSKREEWYKKAWEDAKIKELLSKAPTVERK